jgi:hypothetical protein
MILQQEERGPILNLLMPTIESGAGYYNSNSFISGLLSSPGSNAGSMGYQPGIDKPTPLPTLHGGKPDMGGGRSLKANNSSNSP